MKKICRCASKIFLVLVFSLVSVLTLFGGAVSAENKGKLTLHAERNEFSRGEVFVAALEMNRNPGVATLRVTVKYDPLVLKAESITDEGLLPGYSFTQSQDGQIILRWNLTDGESTATGNLAKIAFRVSADAVYGDSAVYVQYSKALFDICDKNGQHVEFQTTPLNFSLPCPHSNTEETVVQEATLAQEGIIEEKCLACGRTETKQFLPTLSSSDGQVTVTLQKGALDPEKEHTVFVEYYYGGEDYDLAKRYFPDTLFRAFRVKFVSGKSGEKPIGETLISLRTEFDLPEEFSLYSLGDEGLEKCSVEHVQTTLDFTYSPDLFLLVSRKSEDSPPEIPSDPILPDPTVPADPVATEEVTETVVFVLFVVMFILFGVGIVFLLKKKKPF